MSNAQQVVSALVNMELRRQLGTLADYLNQPEQLRAAARRVIELSAALDWLTGRVATSRLSEFAQHVLQTCHDWALSREEAEAVLLLARNGELGGFAGAQEDGRKHELLPRQKPCFVTTLQRMRGGQPRHGTPAEKYVFENHNGDTHARVLPEIIQALETYLDEHAGT